MDPNPKGPSMQLIKRPSAIRQIVIALLMLFVSSVGLVATATSASAAVKSCSASTPTAQLPVLKRGDTGSCVKYAQLRLSTYEYLDGTLSLDGSFGPGMERSVKAFQRDFKIPPYDDGIVGPKTWAKLKQNPPPNGP